MFAKTVVQTMYFRGIHRPFREQVRSHGLRPESKADACAECGESSIQQRSRLKSKTPWERACSRRQQFRRRIFAA
ncbi:hypothetical protein BW686_04115 [Pseudomonas syringae]|uniref:Uncharacterized protein n=1 Tax=Pseudomonas syringae TaxID=317 RepID=A0A244EVD8_PSESX|nr:hypothetical protein BW686_04115 [Pseudomonas syringae]